MPYGLLAIFPMLAICLMLGGVSFAQFAKTSLALLTTLFFSLAAGIFVSTYNRKERVAMFFTLLVLLLFAIGPVFLADKEFWPVWLLSPGLALLLAIDPFGGLSGFLPTHAYWLGLPVTWLITMFFLYHSSSKLPHSWQEKEPKPAAAKLVSFQLPQPDRTAAKKFRAQVLEINPFFWLTLRGREKLNHTWGFVIAIIVIWFLGFLGAGRIMWDYDLLFPTLLFIHAFLKIWVMSETTTGLVEDRRSGALELLLSTPLDVKEIIRGQHLALHRQFAAPFLLLIFLEAICFLFFIAGHGSDWNERLFVPVAIILLVADFYTIRWVGMWVGLNAKNVNRAIMTTATLVLIVPTIIYNLLIHLIPFAYGYRGQISDFTAISGWLIVALLTDLVLFLWAKPRLLNRFRLIATQSHSKTEEPFKMWDWIRGKCQ